MSKILGIIALIVVGIPLTLFSGVVLADYWRWFILPVFAAPPITYLQAVGIMLVAGFFKLGLEPMRVEGQDDAPILTGFAKQFGYAIGTLVLWGSGAIWAQFI